jgi:hypothetical protein
MLRVMNVKGSLSKGKWPGIIVPERDNVFFIPHLPLPESRLLSSAQPPLPWAPLLPSPLALLLLLLLYLFLFWLKEPGSSGSIVSDYGLDDRAIGVRSPAGAKDFFL